MAFTDAEKVQIRRWMGGSFLFVATDQRLEAAMTTVENLDETPTGQTEAYIRDTLLVQLEATFVELTKVPAKMAALAADEVKIDFVRAAPGIRSVGRIWSNQLANALGFTEGPLADAWGPGTPSTRQQLGDRR